MIETYNKYGINVINIFFESPDVVENYLPPLFNQRIKVYSYAKLHRDHTDALVRVKKTTRILLKDKNEEKILSEYSKTARNEIRRTLTMKELQFKSDNKQKEKVYPLYYDFEKKQGRKPFPYNFFKNLLLFTAATDGEYISAIACRDTKPVLKVFAIFSKRLSAEDKEFYKLIGFASKRLVWEICRYGIYNNYTMLDLAYVSLKEESKRGIDDFKLQFGGDIADEYQYLFEGKMASCASKTLKIKNNLMNFFGTHNI